MTCQAEMENHRYHCQLGLNSPLPGEGVLWQEKPTLEVEGDMFTSLSCHSLHAWIRKDSAEVLFFFQMDTRCLCAVKTQLSCISFLSHFSIKWGKYFLTSQYLLTSQGCCKGNYTKDYKVQYEWTYISTLSDRQKDEYHPRGAKTPAVPVTATETIAIYLVAYTIAKESY